MTVSSDLQLWVFVALKNPKTENEACTISSYFCEVWGLLFASRRTNTLLAEGGTEVKRSRHP